MVRGDGGGRPRRAAEEDDEEEEGVAAAAAAAVLSVEACEAAGRPHADVRGARAVADSAEDLLPGSGPLLAGLSLGGRRGGKLI